MTLRSRGQVMLAYLSLLAVVFFQSVGCLPQTPSPPCVGFFCTHGLPQGLLGTMEPPGIFCLYQFLLLEPL